MNLCTKFLAATVLVAFGSVHALDDSLSLEEWKTALSENDEYLHALQTLDRKVMENAKVLINNVYDSHKVMFDGLNTA